MKKIAMFILTVALMLSLTSVGWGQRPGRSDRPAREQGPAAERQGRMQTQLVQRLRQQIDDLKAGHNDLIAELRAIHKMAVKEKATETSKHVEQLISKRQETFRDKLRGLEQQQQRLQRALQGRADRPDRARQRGRPAPEFDLNSFEGKNVKLSEYKGKIVVLEWLNFECPFSLYHYQTTPTMVNLAKKYKDKNVVWFAINSTNHTTPEANRAFSKKHKLPFAILDDRPGAVGRKYGARTTPHMFVIDKDGNIVYNGAIDSAPMGKVTGDGGKVNYVDKALAELTSGQDVSVPGTPPYGCSVKYKN